MNRQIYQAIRAAILDRVLPVGLQLSSSRDLALELGVSRNTILYAYEQLIAEGYLETRSGAGTFVADTVPSSGASAPAPAPAARLSQRGQGLVARAGASEVQWGAFMPGVPDVTLFPHKVWNRLHNKVGRQPGVDLLTYGSGAGHLGLREAVADYLRVARAVNCDAACVLITTGIHQSIDLAARMLGDVGDQAWVESPGYWGTLSILRSLGIAPQPVAVDAEGMHPSPAQLASPPRLLFATPSHQYPLGTVMSLSRRRMLLEYAAANGVWIMEDDYDSEFRYGGRPLASLQGMDSGQRVLYMGTFSKTLFPGLRIGYLVVPPALAAPFATGLSELARGGQQLTQAVLAAFIREGHFATHIRRARIVYGERLRLLQQAVQQHFGERVGLSGADAGLHLTLILPDAMDDVAIARAAKARGIVVRPLSGYYQDAQARRGLILGYACVPDQAIAPLFATLATIIEQHWSV